MHCLSIDYQCAPARERSQFVPDRSHRARLQFGLARTGGCVLLATCHRVELYFLGSRSVAEEYFFREANISSEHFVYYEEATEHLFALAAGLKSMVVGEDEILHQIRTAYEAAREFEIGTELHEAFQYAIRCGKRVRAETGISSVACSIATLAANRVFRFIKGEGNVLLVGGSGKIGQSVLGNLQAKARLTIFATERTHAFSATQAASNVFPVPYAERYDFLDRADAVVSCTASPHVVFPFEEVSRALLTPKNRLFLDLAMPADIGEGVGGLAGVTLASIDDFRAEAEENSRRRQSLASDAHVIVMRCLTEYYARSRTKARIWDTLPDLPSRHFLSERESWEKDGKE